MKFAVAALLATLTTTCFAQGANLGSPANGTSITPGQNLVVQINRPVYLPNWLIYQHDYWRRFFFSRTVWRAALSLVSWSGYYHATMELAFLLARHWEPFYLMGPLTQYSHHFLILGLLRKTTRSLSHRRWGWALQGFPSSIPLWLE